MSAHYTGKLIDSSMSTPPVVIACCRPASIGYSGGIKQPDWAIKCTVPTPGSQNNKCIYLFMYLFIEGFFSPVNRKTTKVREILIVSVYVPYQSEYLEYTIEKHNLINNYTMQD